MTFKPEFISFDCYGTLIDFEMGPAAKVLFKDRVPAERMQAVGLIRSFGAAKHKEIIECYNVSGGYDYLLKIVAPGVGHFQALMDQMLEDDMGIERFASRIVLRQPLNRREYPLNIIATRKRWE